MECIKNRMEAVRQARNKYCSSTMIVAILIGCVFLFSGEKDVCKGLILGAVFSVINFVIMGETITSKIGKTRQRAVIFSFSSIIFRYILLAIPLIVAVKMKQFNLSAAIIGIFGVQIIILCEHIFNLMLPGHKPAGLGK